MHRKGKTYSWLSEEIAPAERTEAWQTALCRSYQEWALTQAVSPDFRAHLVRHEFDDLSLINTICDPCEGKRDHQTVKRDDDIHIGIQLSESGSERFHSAGHSLEVGAGDLIVWTTANATRFEVTRTLHKLTLMLPWRLLRERFPGHKEPPCGGRVESRHGIGYLLANHMRAMASELLQLEHHLLGAASRSLLELVNALLHHDARAAGDNASVKRQLIQEYILRHLHDDALSPGVIASAHQISLRQLHLLFQHEDMAVSRFILQKRLEACKNMLSDPAFNHLQISEIAYSKGFNSMSHFSRVFKLAFDYTPNELRRLLAQRLNRK
ncbi:helix-turn-helix domain-containing protein [Herbaspirillum sp. DW155]|uniref:helix-turn-helix domain-containing protein n=1 Tax=Herbaspirillum sp. DW155 TaxID=3095609 RepID=UPI003093AC63|nr:helix-turn-helix domain-containing protein [Herbaspirillum sp. DW155]